MFICKMGFDHQTYGINNQDGGLIKDNLSIIMDGCSSTEHPEVGIELMINIIKNFEKDFTLPNIARIPYMIRSIFNRIMCFLLNHSYINTTLVYILNKDNIQTISKFLTFTILTNENNEKEFIVNYCGDGFIITQDYNDNLDFIELEHKIINNEEYPNYFIYNYFPNLKPVQFETKIFDKTKYKKVGLATDGLRYILNYEDKYYKDQFINLLKTDSELKLKRFINANYHIFKDDITIAF